MTKIFDPLASYKTISIDAQIENYINGDFTPNHKGDYRKGIAVTGEEITDTVSDDNLPFAVKTDFEDATDSKTDTPDNSKTDKGNDGSSDTDTTKTNADNSESTDDKTNKVGK